MVIFLCPNCAQTHHNWVQNEPTGRLNFSLFCYISLFAVALLVAKNCAHNPKVVSSNLTPATNSRRIGRAQAPGLLFFSRSPVTKEPSRLFLGSPLGSGNTLVVRCGPLAPSKKSTNPSNHLVFGIRGRSAQYDSRGYSRRIGLSSGRPSSVCNRSDSLSERVQLVAMELLEGFDQAVWPEYFDIH
jgi:hypothetical protein